MSEEVKTKKKFRFRFPLWAKTLVVLLLSVVSISVVATVYSSNQLSKVTREHYINKSIELADTLGIYLNLDDIKAVKSAVDTKYRELQATTPEAMFDNSCWGEEGWLTYLHNFDFVTEMNEYKSLLAQIELFHSKNDAKFTYLGYADLENKRLVYLVDDSEYTGDPSTSERCMPGTFDKFTKQDMSIYKHIEKGFEPEITNMPEYGYLVSVGRPIFDENHELVAFSLVDLSMDAIINEENQSIRNLTIILVSIGAGVLLICYLLVLWLIIRPVRKLTRTANQYLNGTDEDLNKFKNVRINTKDEIEDLSNSMKKMEDDINHYISDLLSTTNKLEGAKKEVDIMKYYADRDALTGLMNKRSYFEEEERLNKLIEDGKAKFAISMIDLNDLKITNDTLGHEKGDALIVSVSEVVKRVFKNSTIYRIGGDEFVVISENKDYDNIVKLEKDFITEIDNAIKEGPKEGILTSAAIGVAIFDPKSDNNVEDTFKRADRAMYARKHEMKENNQ